MNYKTLLLQSQEHLRGYPVYIKHQISYNVFSLGAKWMFDRLNEVDPYKKGVFDPSVNFGFYGLLKYGICIASFFISAFLLFRVNIFLSPLGIIVFYFFEVQFLFLFPLLIDKVENPIWTSIEQTYKIGIIKALVTVIPIAFFMLIGLFDFKAPFRNWHIGSLAIIIWYKNEVRNRVSTCL